LKKHIPNTITCLNLFCGCLACIAAFKGDFTYSAVWIVAGAGFDFFDGLAARLLKAYSPTGKELDSLADVITFGMAPGIAAFTFLQLSLFQEEEIVGSLLIKIIPCIAFLIPVFSALRLAKFNIDERQTTSFLGLPVPANALFWAGLLFGMEKYLSAGLYLPLIIIGLILLFSFLLVSEIPMFSLKLKNFSWKENFPQYLLVILTILFILIFRFEGVAFGIVAYIIMSVINSRLSRK